MQNKPSLVILAAGRVTSKLPFFSSLSECPALVPMGTKSSILHQLDFYENKVQEVYILTNQIHVNELEKELLPEKIKNKFKQINVIGCNTKNVIKTLQFFCRNQLFKINKEYIVNLATTIPNKLLPKNTFGLSVEKKIQQDWSGVKIKKSKSHKYYYRKNISDQLINAFIGIFRISGKDLYNNSIKCKSDDLIEIMELYSFKKKIKFSFQKWMDIGHSSNYFDTKIKLISSRYFNSIKVDDVKGTIIKSSTDKEKIRNEFLYINSLPRDLKIFFPRILSEMSDIKKNSYLEMEYYAYPTLSEVSLFWEINSGQWENFFQSLSTILNKFKKNNYYFSKKAYQNFYYERLVKRVEQFMLTLNSEYYEILNNEKLLVNNELILDTLYYCLE